MGGYDPWFDTIYKRNAERLVRIAEHVLGDRELAEDLMQDTFMVLLAKRHETETYENPDAYLVKVLRNRIGSEIQKAERKRVEPLEEKHTPFMAVEDRETMDEILPNWLTEQERQLLIWRAEEGRSMQEIAVLLGCSEHACHMKMYRLRNKFEKYYKKENMREIFLR